MDFWIELMKSMHSNLPCAKGRKEFCWLTLLNSRAIAAPVGRFREECENGCGMYITAQDTWKQHTERMACTCSVKLNLKLSEGNLGEIVILQNLWIWISTGILSGKDLNLIRSQSTVPKPSSFSKAVWRLGFVTYQGHFSAANVQWCENCTVRSLPTGWPLNSGIFLQNGFTEKQMMPL